MAQRTSLDLVYGSWLSAYRELVPKPPFMIASPSHVAFSELRRLDSFQPKPGFKSRKPYCDKSLYLFSSALDEARFPRRGVGDTGEISEGWLRRSNHKPKTNTFRKSSIKHRVQDLRLSGFVKAPHLQLTSDCYLAKICH
jgi:hypothetical protein